MPHWKNLSFSTLPGIVAQDRVTIDVIGKFLTLNSKSLRNRQAGMVMDGEGFNASNEIITTLGNPQLGWVSESHII